MSAAGRREFHWKAAAIGVRTGLSTFVCMIGPNASCDYCWGDIVWGIDRRARPIALEPWDDNELTTTPHFDNCNYRKAEKETVERWLRLQ